MQKRMSLSGILVLVMGAVVAGTFLLCWIFNSTFLEKYYTMKKQQELQNTYSILNSAAISDDLTKDTFDDTFRNLCTKGNLLIIIADENTGKVVRSSTYDTQELQMEFTQLMINMENSNVDVLENHEDYSILKRFDVMGGYTGGSMILSGTLEDGSKIYMSTALESIKESAQITNSFFRYVSIGAFVITLIVIVFVAKLVAKPIKNLSELSLSMTKLEFETKYHTNKFTPREIDSLGHDMNKMSDTLEKTISELKTANLELKQDIAKKEEVDQMRKEFVSNVSHELKTPLALISGYAEGLQEGVSEDPESRAFYCEVIQDEAEKMNQMVKKLLTLNQLEFGNEPLDMSRFDVTELVRGVVNASGLLISQNNIQMEISEESPVYVWGDEFKVEEVISNYLSNAIHYVQGNPKKIRIEITKQETRVRVSVFNTGSHIPEDELDKVWIKFYKVDKARTREYGGNGIGLSIVKAIMESMGQKCGALNHVDGVEFWMELDAKN